MITMLTAASRGPVGTPSTQEALEDAAVVAGLAPSIFNSQPWSWTIGPDTLTLRPDLSRQIRAIDPRCRLLTVSCGASLHHAYTELTALGCDTTVTRPADVDGHLARITVAGTRPIPAAAADLADAAWFRRTDRRPFAPGTSVAPGMIQKLLDAATSDRVLVEDVTSRSEFVAIAATAAADIELRNSAYQSALRSWIESPDRIQEGVPLSTVARRMKRRVPVRDFAAGRGRGQLESGIGDDASASYLVVATDDDNPADWLVSGEAVSAILLTATRLGLGSSPMSDVVEVPGARALIRSLLTRPAYPQLVIRVGVPSDRGIPPGAPRRTPLVEPPIG